MKDLCSYSTPEDVVIEHIDWNITVDFETQTLSGEALYTLRIVHAPAVTVNFDTSHLRIVEPPTCILHDATKTEIRLEYTLHKAVPNKPHLGRRLEIDLASTRANGTDAQDRSLQIRVKYQTTPECSGLQWLPPSQTAGKKFPYLFTQCQAIHARSLLPCQDRCGVKFTYTAKISVPSWATPVMSALLVDEETPSPAEDDDTATTTHTCVFNQPVPISSYLLALAVGELEKRTLSDRCAVWSEPCVVAAAADEFQDTEQFLQQAEALTQVPYPWHRYDLLCLPPSFPYGGMENPCLTFVTPTLLAGDRSLADVVAHEIAHSWTGNLVTCATWDHFWLNEGWTMWLQRKIMVRMKQDPTFLDFDALEGRKALADTVAEFLSDEVGMPQNTRLVLDGGDDDPDDSYSTVAYEKGFTFLLYLERNIVGTAAFVTFFQAYIAKFASTTVTSEDFKEFFMQYFWDDTKYPKVAEIDWPMWYHWEGMPPVLPALDQTLAQASLALAQAWYDFDRNQHNTNTNDNNKQTSGERVALEGWSSGQITCFLDALESKTYEDDAPRPLQVATLTAMNAMYAFDTTKNAEILYRYCQLAIASEDTRILPTVIRFITSQGRMKYVRPLYKSLFKSDMGGDIAVETFLEHKDFYHPIATKMIAIDLKVAMTTATSNGSAATATAKAKAFSISLMSNKNQIIIGTAIVAVASIAVALARSKRK